MVCFVEISISIQIFSSKGKKSIIFKNPLTLVDTGHFFIPAPKPFSSYGSLFYVSWSLLFSDWDITGMDREWKHTLGITLSFARELTNRPFLSLISGISLLQGYFQTNPFPSCHVPAYSVELPGPSLNSQYCLLSGPQGGVSSGTHPVEAQVQGGLIISTLVQRQCKQWSIKTQATSLLHASGQAQEGLGVRSGRKRHHVLETSKVLMTSAGMSAKDLG